MKILLVNKFYYPRGGDCIYTINLEHLLKSKGHEVAVFSMQHPESIESEWSRYFPREVNFLHKKNLAKIVASPLGRRDVREKISALLDHFKADVVHLNNIHSQLSPVVAKIAHEKGIKVVWTLHDYKLLCPRYDCMRNGKQICEVCFHNKMNVIKYRCAKNSFLGSLLAYFEAVKWSKEKLENYTDCFISPSKFLTQKMAQGGFQKEKIILMNNFINEANFCEKVYEKEDYYCYVGRLSPEKGIETLINAASVLPYRLIVIGGGAPLKSYQERFPGSNIEFIGHQNWEKIKEIMGKARFTVIPSEWYENNPLSVIESLCLGTPVLGANIGGIPELIVPENGLLFESGNESDLKKKIDQMYLNSYNYQLIANDSILTYSSENYYKKLIKIYA
jgi:Glycosyltransferase